MNVYINNIPTTTPTDFMTIQSLLEWCRVHNKVISVSLNDIIINKEKWKITKIKDLDRITFISGVFNKK